MELTDFIAKRRVPGTEHLYNTLLQLVKIKNVYTRTKHFRYLTNRSVISPVLLALQQ
jgi:hypothetical protein